MWGSDRFGAPSQNGTDLYTEDIGAFITRVEVDIACDDVSGKDHIPEEVRKAMLVELAYVEGMQVCSRVPRSHQHVTGGTIIRTRWLDANKGMGAHGRQVSFSGSGI